MDGFDVYWKLLTVTVQSELDDLLNLLVSNEFEVKYGVFEPEACAWPHPDYPVIYEVRVKEVDLQSAARLLSKYGTPSFLFKQNGETIRMREALQN